jgi:hypothetical protein
MTRPLTVPRHPAAEPLPECGDDFTFQLRALVDDVDGRDDGIYQCLPGAADWEAIASVDHTHDAAVTQRTVTTAVGASTEGTATATCTGDGEVVVGGGCEFDGASLAGSEVHVSKPGSATTWVCAGTNNATPRNLIAHAICLTRPV